MNAGLIAGAGLGLVLFYAWQQRERMTWGQWPQEFESLGASIGGAISEALEGLGMVRVANMRSVNRSLVNHRNVRAMFAVIRRGEGTSGVNGYRTLFGGGLFSSFADHPRQAVTKWGYTSTAAGAYQFLAKVWDETAQAMVLTDFSPESQDLAALGRIAARGALPDVLAGRFDAAISKINREWASMPGSPYGQGTISAETARQVYASAGGLIAGSVVT